MHPPEQINDLDKDLCKAEVSSAYLGLLNVATRGLSHLTSYADLRMQTENDQTVKLLSPSISVPELVLQYCVLH